MNDFINEYFNKGEYFYITAKTHPNDFKLSVYSNTFAKKRGLKKRGME